MAIAYIKSPMNYTGGKYKILPHIIPCFPEHVNNFIDLFAGGLNVCINVNAKCIYANDHITYLIDFYKYLKNIQIEELITNIKNRIKDFNLTQTNQEGYLNLRTSYNKKPNPLDLFLLVCYSFNHQIRFNNKHEFNTPFGKERSSFNNSIENNLKAFCNVLQKKHFILTSYDFRKFDYSKLGINDFVYCDPPYLITNGSYNDGKRGFRDWSKEEEKDLLFLLDKLNSKNIKFALSNVFYHKGTSNDLLIKWADKYNITYIDKNYSNCSYHFKDRTTTTVEVLITNYNWSKPICKQLQLSL